MLINTSRLFSKIMSKIQSRMDSYRPLSSKNTRQTTARRQTSGSSRSRFNPRTRFSKPDRQFDESRAVRRERERTFENSRSEKPAYRSRKDSDFRSERSHFQPRFNRTNNRPRFSSDKPRSEGRREGYNLYSRNESNRPRLDRTYSRPGDNRQRDNTGYSGDRHEFKRKFSPQNTNRTNTKPRDVQRNESKQISKTWKKNNFSKSSVPEKIHDQNSLHRVQKLLSNYGFTSRRSAESLIEEGRVTVNGKQIHLGDKAKESDLIAVDGKSIKKEKKLYLMFNKPVGCVTALTDDRQKTIIDFIKIPERIFPIGRLDFNTSGLLLLTNDGDFANRIMHPSYEIKKTYLVKLDKDLSSDAIKRIENGMTLDDGRTAPAKVKKTGDALFEIIIHEGKNRIIRRMMGFLGYHVVFLERIKIGSLYLGNLKQGKYRVLLETDKDLIFK